MNHRYLAFVAALGLSACGPNLEKACQNYVDAWSGCIDQAFADDAALLESTKAALEGACDEYADVKGDAADQAAELLQCYTDAIEGGDCADPTAYAEVMVDVSLCSGPAGLL